MVKYYSEGQIGKIEMNRKRNGKEKDKANKQTNKTRREYKNVLALKVEYCLLPDY
jgi:hypothetical protein